MDISIKLLKVVAVCIAAGVSVPAFSWPGDPWPGPWGPPPGPWGGVVILSAPLITAPPVPAPQVYVEKAPRYRYYCPESGGYYPDIPRCPKGWMKVIPHN